MVRVETVAASHLRGRVRCRPAHPTDDTGVAESLRFLPAKGAYTLRDRTTQWRFALAVRFSPAREPKGMGLWLKESVPISAFRSLHLSQRGSDHSRFVPNVFRVCRISRQTVFCPRARHRSLPVFR